MSNSFRSGKGELIKVPAPLKPAFMVLVRQIDDDLDAVEALHWLISLMERRGSAPKWPSENKKGFNMKYGNYSLFIVGARETSEGYAALKMKNGKAPFKISMTNNSTQKTKAQVKIHGIDQGTWVLYPFQSITIDRPAHIQELFHAYAVGSEGGNAIGLQSGDPNNGLVSVTFKPELRTVCRSSYGEASETLDSYHLPRGPKSFGAAGVGTEGTSNQQFELTSDFETDPARIVTINLRIVEDKEVTKPRSLSSAVGNSVPPIVG